MASPSSTRIWFRLAILIALVVVLFYVGRPLYWKISATTNNPSEKVYRRSYKKRRDRWGGITTNPIQGSKKVTTRNPESPPLGDFFSPDTSEKVSQELSK